MKKLIYCATALVAALFAASCQREMHEPVAEGGVTYTITLPETVQTRGASGYAEYDLYFEVYKTADLTELKDADVLFDNFDAPIEMTSNTTEVPFDLLNDQDYTILFWANKKDADWFVLDDLRKVGIKSSASNNNDRDAFCAMDQLENVNGALTKTVTLTRPFAQLNIATLVSTTAGYTLTPLKSYVKVSDVPVTYNVATGDVSEDKEVEFTVNKVPEGKKVNGTYDLVAMNYVLVPQGNVDVYYEIETVNGTVKNTVNNVPLKKNYRTNIIGNLLTSNASYTVEIKPGFETEQYYGPEFVKEPAYDAETKTYTVVDPYELLWVADQVNSGANDFSGQTVQLAADIDLENKPWTPIGLNADDAKKFKGTFEGVALTKADTYPVIRNLYVETSPGYTAAGFFGALNGTAKNFGIENATIKHISTGDPTDNGIAVVAGSIYNKGNIEGVTVKNATVEGNRYVGGIAGYTYGNVKNCSVENLTLKATPDQQADGSYNNGDKVGGIVAAFWWEQTYNVSGNTAKNVSIYAYRDAGIIAGHATGEGVKNNTVDGKNNITIDQETYFYEKKDANAGEIVGRLSGTLADGNTVTGEVSFTTLINVDEPESFASVVAAAKDGDIITVADGEFDLPSSIGATGEGTITFVGNGMESTQLNGSTNPSGNADSPGNYAHGKDIVFKNMTFKTVNVGYQGGIGHAKSVTFINCKIIGQFYCHSEAPHYFYDCTIDPLTGYLYTYASDCVFEGCTFEASEGKALQVYGEADVECDVTIKDCDFIAAKQATTWDSKPVTGIDINSANNYRVNVTVTNCTTTGFPTGLNSDSDLYNIKEGGIGKVNLVIDGVYVVRAGYTPVEGYANLYTDKDGVYCIFDKAGLADFHDFIAAKPNVNPFNKTFKLMDDIDAEGYVWNSVCVIPDATTFKGIVLDGNDKAISNLTIAGEGMFNMASAGSVIKNITMDNVTNNSEGHNAAIFWGSVYSSVSFDNVHIKNSAVNGLCNAGAFVGGTYEPNNLVVTFKNCSVENSAVKAVGYGGQDPTGASGFLGKAYASSKVVFEGTNSIDDATTITNENGLVGGKVYGYTTWYGDGFKGTGSCDQFKNWEGISFETVSTPEEMKDVLTAAGAAGSGNTTILFDGDIDMTGEEWTPIKVDGYRGAGVVVIDGNGAVITGLTSPLFAGGFAGGSGIVIRNLTIADSDIVSTNTIGSGAFIDSIDSMPEITLENCHLLNSTVTGGPGSRTGGLIGWTAGYNNQNDGPVKTYVKINNCSVVGSTIQCDGSVGAIYGHAGNNAWTFSTVENCTVKDCTLNSTDDGGWRVGVVVGTANVGELTINNITESGNTLTQTGKTAPTGEKRNYYGRFVPGSTGKLVIDGVEVTE